MSRFLYVRLQYVLTLTSIALLSACSGDHPQTTFQPVTEFGRSLNRLFANTFWWTIGIMVLVELLIVVSIFKFRERPGQPKPKQIHGNVKFEVLWTLIPAVIVLFISIPTIQTIFDTQKQAPADAVTVEVVGHQWWWEFRYPGHGVITANEMVLPVGETVNLKMYSADVIHSFWVPRVGGKRDVNPVPRIARGEHAPRSNYLVFNIEQPGYYLGQCAEFCGTSHAIMRTAIRAVPADEFEAWVISMGGAHHERGQAAQPRDTLSAADSARPQTLPAAATPTPAAVAPTPTASAAPTTDAERGKQIFSTKMCIACHTIHGTTARGVIGPSLTRFGARRSVGAGAKPNTLENVIAWITSPSSLKPAALMPGTKTGIGGVGPGTGLTDEEVRLIAVYLTSLK